MCKLSGVFRRWKGGRLLALKTLDGYASVFACSCKQRDQGHNIMQLQMLMQIGHNLS